MSLIVITLIPELALRLPRTMGNAEVVSSVVVPAVRRDPYAVALRLSDVADAFFYQQETGIMGPGVRACEPI